MSLHRIKTQLLAIGLSFVLAVSALGQGNPDLTPDLGDMQPFSQPDWTGYDGAVPRFHGWYGSIEATQWLISTPDVTPVGREGFHPLTFDGLAFVIQPNSLDTSFIDTSFRTGQRLEFGHIDEDGIGFFASGFGRASETDTVIGSDAGISIFSPFVNGISILEGFVDVTGPGGLPDGFDDDINFNNVFGRDGIDIGTPNGNPPPAFIPPPDGVPDLPFPTDFGDLVYFPVFFDKLVVTNRTDVWGMEVMLARQTKTNARGGYWEGFIGPRYLSFQEEYSVVGFGRDVTFVDGNGNTVNTTLGVLADSVWFTKADNNLVGPQIGLRYVLRRGRVKASADARFMAAANFQSIRQSGTIASEFDPLPLRVQNRPVNLVPTAFFNSVKPVEFSPLLELRANASYQIFSSIAVNVGWTGMFMDGIARPSNMVDWILPTFGLLEHNNRQDVFMHGINFGIEVNH